MKLESFMKTVAVIILCLLTIATAWADSRLDRFEIAVRAFEIEHDDASLAKDATLFVGSSSIARWRTLANDIGISPVYSRGLNGAYIADIIYFFERIVVPLQPRRIVFYCGENDIYSGKSPAQVMSDFKTLVEKVKDSLPQARIFFLSLKPSPARWARWERMVQTNRLIQTYAKENNKLTYVDVSSLMFSSTGLPRDDIWAKDRLHINDQGYQLWARSINAVLER